MKKEKKKKKPKIVTLDTHFGKGIYFVLFSVHLFIATGYHTNKE